MAPARPQTADPRMKICRWRPLTSLPIASAAVSLSRMARIIEVARTGISILMVEQNARQALEIADRGYVLVQGRNAHTGTGQELLADPDVRRSFLGG